MVKILIVEDDNDINNMIHDLLRLNCIESVSAYSGTEALLLLDEHVDLVLLDLMLPGLSGQEVIKEIKKNYEMGFISSHEFLCEYAGVLSKLGAQGELIDAMNTVLAPLADFIVKDILNASDDEKKQIKDFFNFK